MRRLIFVLPALALACSDGSVQFDDTAVIDSGDADTDTDSDTDTDTDTDSDTDADCEDAIDYLEPGNGTIGVSPNPVLRVWLDDPATGDVAIALTSPGGDDVPGATASQSGDQQWTFTPDDELDRDATYSWTATTCTDEESAEFTTVEGPIDPTGLKGKTYDIAMDEVTWNSPSQTIGAMLLGYIDTDHILVHVDDIDSDNETITTIGAMAWTSQGATEQYPCTEAIPFEPADFSGNPYFQSGPSTTIISAAGYDLSVEEFTVGGSFNSDLSAINNMRVVGYLDVAELEFQGVAACTALAFLGGECVACPSSGDEDCVKLDIEDPEASVTNAAFDKDIDPSLNPDCQ